jgi:NADH-quinone oxidoreductase subunit H
MADLFSTIDQLLKELLTGLGLDPFAAAVLLKFLAAAILGTLVISSAIFLIWLERKLIARIQDRLGPNRVGPYGLFQTVADALKLVTKEVLIPRGADLIPFLVAPLLAVMSVVGIWAVIPLAPGLVGADIPSGSLFVIAIGAVGTLGILLAGISSNNKYALLGAFRTVAQMVSYAVPLILAVLVPSLLAGSMSLVSITEAQGAAPFILLAPLAALIFFISSIAEVGRAPFDLLEAESELVAGFHIEYSGLAFGMFFVGEFVHAFTISALTAVFFLGGWQGPWVDQVPLLGLVYLLAKTGIVYFVVIWIRGTFPRIRIDQINSFNWKFVTPLALATLSVTAIVDKVAIESGLSRLVLNLAANIGLFLLTLLILWLVARSARRREEASPDIKTPGAPARGIVG